MVRNSFRKRMEAAQDHEYRKSYAAGSPPKHVDSLANALRPHVPLMKFQRFLIAISVVNFALPAFTLAQLRPVVAESVPPVLRGRALEIVDNRGESEQASACCPLIPRAQIQVANHIRKL